MAFVCDCGRLRLPGSPCVCGRPGLLVVILVAAALLALGVR